MRTVAAEVLAMDLMRVSSGSSISKLEARPGMLVRCQPFEVGCFVCAPLASRQLKTKVLTVGSTAPCVPWLMCTDVNNWLLSVMFGAKAVRNCRCVYSKQLSLSLIISVSLQQRQPNLRAGQLQPGGE